MNGNRILINVAVFAAVGVIMTVWAFQSVVRFDFIEKPYHVTAEFQSSPGLHPGFEVDYLGMKVGKIDSVRLTDHKVVVRLDIDKGVRLPREVTAAAARKSAVGEPVVELTPVSGRHGGPQMPTDGSALIPVSRTTVPPKYGDLLGAINKAFSAIDPDDARVLSREFAAGLAGRGDSIQRTVADLDQLTGTFAANSALLDRLTKDMGNITQVLAANRGQLGAGFDNLGAVMSALRAVRGEIAQVRDRGPGFIDRFDSLLKATNDDFECTVDSLGAFFPALATRQNMRYLRQTLAQAPALSNILKSVLVEEKGQMVLRSIFVITFFTKATLEYKYPLAQPTVDKIPRCADGRQPALVKQKKYAGAKPGETIPTHDPSVNRPRSVDQRSADSPAGPPLWALVALPLVALLVLIRVMTGSVPVVSHVLRARRATRGRRRKS